MMVVIITICYQLLLLFVNYVSSCGPLTSIHRLVGITLILRSSPHHRSVKRKKNICVIFFSSLNLLKELYMSQGYYCCCLTSLLSAFIDTKNDPEEL